MEININSFQENLYVELKEDYKRELIKELSKLKLDYLSKELGVSKTTIITWKKRTEYFPLRKINQALKIIKKSSLKDCEKNIIAYGTKLSALHVKNPILPIKDSPELREIVIHIMCDGCYNKNSGYAAYYNFPKETKEEFVKELNKCFGEIDYKISEDHVHFPTVIALILKNNFAIDFNSKRCRIPKEFFRGERRELSAIIRAAVIDEGTIDGSNVRIDSCNKEFLEDLKKICENLGYICGKTWESKGPIFRFNILAESLKQLKEDILPLPIEKKQLLIELAENNQRRNWKYQLPGEVKKQILKSLLKKPKRNIELILGLGYPKSTIGKHLRWLIKSGIIYKKTERNLTIYLIEEENKAKEFIKNPSKFIKSDKINNYGLNQLKLLKLLNKRILKYSEIRKNLKVSKSTLIKLLSRLKKKNLINKMDKKGWSITEKGKKILLLKEKKARYYLYANVK